MRLMLAFTLGCLLLAGTAPCAAQEGKTAKGIITTTGSATVQVQPDSVRVTFGVQFRYPSVREARLESEKQTQRITDALNALKINTLKIVTASENLQITMSSNPGGLVVPPGADMPLVPTGYQVKTSFTVTAKATDMGKLRDMAKSIIDAAVDNGANLGAGGSAGVADDGSIRGGGGGGPGAMGRTVTRMVVSHGAEFFREDTTALRKQALSQAAKDALANAEALAIGANVKIRKIDAITDDFEKTGYGDPYDDPYYNRPPSRSTRLEWPTNTSITVRVRVTCSYE